jgi:hypothetical protein
MRICVLMLLALYLLASISSPTQTFVSPWHFNLLGWSLRRITSVVNPELPPVSFEGTARIWIGGNQLPQHC